MANREQNAVEVAQFEIIKNLPRTTGQYADPHNGLGATHEKYDEIAKVEAVVLHDRVHYQDGHRWAYKDETVKLSPADAKALERAGQVKVVSVAK